MRPALWRRTAWDFSRKRWKLRESAFLEALQLLESSVIESRRDPSLSERESNDYTPYKERIERCTAFGQYATKVSPAEQRLAQLGLFGTAAGFQVLSTSSWAADMRTGAAPTGENSRWLEVYLRCLNFVDLVVSPPDPNPGGAIWEQRRLTLRLCHLLRAVAAAAPTLDALASSSWLTSGSAVTAPRGDLGTPINRIAAAHAAALASMLRDGKRLTSEVDHGYAAGKSETGHLYTFGVTSRDAPTTCDEWVFMWASVLSSVVRCYRQGLLPTATVEELCPPADVRLLENILREPPDDLDRRYRLFGLWAISHLDVLTLGGPLGVTESDSAQVPESLGLNQPEQVQWLCEATRDTTRGLLAKEVALVDSWRPYTTYIGPPTEPEYAQTPGEAADESVSSTLNPRDFRDDYLVVPVVPVLLSLVARYDPRYLCRRAVLEVVKASVDPGHRRDSGRAKPYQLGSRDGVVNLSYWQEAYRALATGARAIHGRVGRRISYVTGATFRDNGRRNVLLVLVLLTAIGYAVAQSTKSFASGVIFAVLASVLAAAISPPIVRYLWADYS